VRNASLNLAGKWLAASDQLKSVTTNHIDDLLDDRRWYQIGCLKFVRKSSNGVDDVIGDKW